MKNTEIFNELTKLSHQPSIWFVARALYGGINKKPDNSRRLLRILDETDNGVTAGTIAEILDIKPSSVTQIIKKLESNNYIKRVPNPKDARVVSVSITDNGKKYLESIDNNRNDFQDDIFNIFNDDEKNELGNFLKRLNDHVSSEEFMNKINDKFVESEFGRKLKHGFHRPNDSEFYDQFRFHHRNYGKFDKHNDFHNQFFS
ncbi:MarR family winged helix-turn-helix transcriptional regulator [Apilactobacillus kunkeei]|uniref:MarR family winged helix-turn-helix transcriptional regulator n=1 Tax=Apilactobacillus kunkeei TaxID=148814 RepID=UPI004034B595